MSLLSYASQGEKDMDKILLNRLRLALGISPSALCLDACHLWQLEGIRGRITTWGDGEGYLLNLYERRSKQAWSWAKKRLEAAGCVLVQNAELEGIFRLTLAICAGSADEIRELAGLRKALSEEASAAASERARERGFGATS
jgi:hypothetical protein